MSKSSDEWAAATGGVNLTEGQFTTMAEQVHRETAACQAALDAAYAEYQRKHDSILRAYWQAMKSITTGNADSDVTQVVPAIEWAQGK